MWVVVVAGVVVVRPCQPNTRERREKCPLLPSSSPVPPSVPAKSYHNIYYVGRKYGGMIESYGGTMEEILRSTLLYILYTICVVCRNLATCQ